MEDTQEYQPVAAATPEAAQYQVALSDNGRFVEFSRVYPDSDCAGIFIRDDKLIGRAVGGGGAASATIDMTDWDVPLSDFEKYDFFEYRCDDKYYRIQLRFLRLTDLPHEPRPVSGVRVEERHPLWPAGQEQMDSDVEVSTSRRTEQARARIERARERERREGERDRQAASVEASVQDRVREILREEGFSDDEIERFL